MALVMASQRVCCLLYPCDEVYSKPDALDKFHAAQVSTDASYAVAGGLKLHFIPLLGLVSSEAGILHIPNLFYWPKWDAWLLSRVWQPPKAGSVRDDIGQVLRVLRCWEWAVTER